MAPNDPNANHARTHATRATAAIGNILLPYSDQPRAAGPLTAPLAALDRETGFSADHPDAMRQGVNAFNRWNEDALRSAGQRRRTPFNPADYGVDPANERLFSSQVNERDFIGTVAETSSQKGAQPPPPDWVGKLSKGKLIVATGLILASLPVAPFAPGIAALGFFYSQIGKGGGVIDDVANMLDRSSNLHGTMVSKVLHGAGAIANLPFRPVESAYRLRDLATGQGETYRYGQDAKRDALTAAGDIGAMGVGTFMVMAAYGIGWPPLLVIAAAGVLATALPWRGGQLVHSLGRLAVDAWRGQPDRETMDSPDRALPRQPDRVTPAMDSVSRAPDPDAVGDRFGAVAGTGLVLHKVAALAERADIEAERLGPQGRDLRNGANTISDVLRQFADRLDQDVPEHQRLDAARDGLDRLRAAIAPVRDELDRTSDGWRGRDPGDERPDDLPALPRPDAPVPQEDTPPALPGGPRLRALPRPGGA